MPEVVPIEPAPPKPSLPGTVVLRRSADELVDAIAAELLMHAAACVRRFGDFHLALSGGSTPQPLYRRLMYDPAYRQLPWKRTHLWLVDERRVPPDDPRSNFREIDELIAQHADIPREQVHPIHALEADADLRYERELAETLIWREAGHDRLDYVLLGMGGDGHTASLFPRSPALLADLDVQRQTPALAPGTEHEVSMRALHAHLRQRRLVRLNAGPSVTPPERVTMTLTMLNASRFVGVMVTGSGKRAAIARVAGREGDAADLPILGVCPRAGELRWYLDYDACPR